MGGKGQCNGAYVVTRQKFRASPLQQWTMVHILLQHRSLGASPWSIFQLDSHDQYLDDDEIAPSEGFLIPMFMLGGSDF